MRDSSISHERELGPPGVRSAKIQSGIGRAFKLSVNVPPILLAALEVGF